MNGSDEVVKEVGEADALRGVGGALRERTGVEWALLAGVDVRLIRQRREGASARAPR